MAEELLRSKHAFGALERVLDAISSGLIDSYDLLLLKDANGKPYFGWVDKDGNPVILQEEKQIITVPTLPSTGETGKIYIYGSDGYFWNGKEFINLCKPTDVSILESELIKLRSSVQDLNSDVTNLKTDIDILEDDVNNVKKDIDVMEKDIDVVKNIYDKIGYEITNTPVGTLVDYREKEIRVMCPKDVIFTKQSVGATGNADMYYMAFKAYAPEGAVSFKEGDRGVIVDEMFTFDSEFAGTDKYGRNYSICWLALASCDSNGKWNYFGSSSTTDKYIGWTYCVEWYDKNDVVIASDCIRINLSNEDCHNTLIPSYVQDITAGVDEKIEQIASEAKTYTDEQIAEIMDAMTVIEF